MSRITLDLSDKLVAELASVGQQTSRSIEVVAQDMIQRMIVIRQFERLRKEVRDQLRSEFSTTEEEILNQIS